MGVKDDIIFLYTGKYVHMNFTSGEKINPCATSFLMEDSCEVCVMWICQSFLKFTLNSCEQFFLDGS